jgi:Serine/threonine protein kinase
MKITEGTKLGRYEIRSLIGVGGMGEVYRATDPKIGRDVAIKVLPADFSADNERVARFEQEARAAGALNHPNILAIYDVDKQDGILYVVSELLEGEELRARLDEGPIPLRKTVNYAQQIVSGLSAAHESGVVHRDLKPENLFVTKDDRVKILDFGLAKLSEPPAASGFNAGSEDATRARVNTAPGMVMGTAGYMSPEQVRGQGADHRSDIFSFGVVLYEMLTGMRAFHGDSVIEMMHAILKDDVPDLDGNGSKTPPALDKLMRRCLEKKPEHRFHSAHDLGFALEALSSPTSSSSGSGLTSAANAVVSETTKSTWRSLMPWIVAGVFALTAMAAFGLTYFNRSSANQKAIRLSFNPPPELSFNDVEPDTVVISPDGLKVVFTATSVDGKNMLYVRNLDSPDAKVLPGSENALEPFWSPDSKSVAYGSNGKLKRSDLTGGNGQILCDAARMVGGSWGKDGTLIFVPDYRTTIMQVSALGGEPKPVAMNVEQGDAERHRYPYFLRDGRHFLFYRELKGIWAGSLDSPEVTQILPDNSPVVYSRQGWLIFIRNDTLVAQAFDSASLMLSGEPIPIIADQKSWINNFRFSASDNGNLVWQGVWERDYQLVWFDREGKQVGTVEAPAKIAVGEDPHISPDGKRVVIKRNPPNTIWVIDLEKGTSVRITSDFGQIPVWSPDGSRILYSGGNTGMQIKQATGLGDAEGILTGPLFPYSWSPDGRFLIFVRRGVKTRLDMYALSMDGERKESLLLNSPANEQNPQLSPDGKWLAYSTDDTGNYEIYVQQFLADGKLGSDRKRISTAGGVMPVWSRDGSELFFIAADGQLMASTVKTGGSEFEFSAPKALFKTRMLGLIGSTHEFDVSPDGKRFLIGTLIGEPTAPPPTVILNWTAILKK